MNPPVLNRCDGPTLYISAVRSGGEITRVCWSDESHAKQFVEWASTPDGSWRDGVYEKRDGRFIGRVSEVVLADPDRFESRA